MSSIHPTASELNTHKALLSTDIDDCLIPWENRKRNGPFNELALRRAADVIRQVGDTVALHLNTGRNLASLKNLAEPTAKACPILDAIRVDFLSTNNGQELYINKKHAKTSTWLRELTEADMDSRWTTEIEKRTGWSLPKVVQARAAVLKTQGFQEVFGEEAQRLALPTYKGLRVYIRPTLGGSLLTVQCFDTQPGFRVSEWQTNQGHLDTPIVEQAGIALQEALQQALKAQYDTETTLSNKPMEAGDARFKAFTLFPVGVNKGAVLNLLLDEYLPQTQAVVTAGDDDYNDLDLLQPLGYRRNGQELPNYPVVVGENKRAQEAVIANPRHEIVPLEQWDFGIRKQLEKLGLLKPVSS